MISGNSNPLQINRCFLDTMHERGSEQIIRFPTRGNNILDVFISNWPNIIKECKSIPGISDHGIVFVETSTRAKRNRPPRRKIFLWKNADTDTPMDDINNFSASLTQDNTNQTNINDLWNLFRHSGLELMEARVPSKMSSPRYSQLWVTRQVKRISKWMKRAFCKARSAASTQGFDSVLGLGAAGGDRCCLVAPWWQIWEHLTRLAYSEIRSRGPQPPRYNEAQLYSRRATAAIWQTMHFACFFFSVSVSY